MIREQNTTLRGDAVTHDIFSFLVNKQSPPQDAPVGGVGACRIVGEREEEEHVKGVNTTRQDQMP